MPVLLRGTEATFYTIQVLYQQINHAWHQCVSDAHWWHTTPAIAHPRAHTALQRGPPAHQIALSDTTP